jgi:predicted ATPase/DNA-binding winged helix-turn-helix (wHTH) protein
VSIESAKRVTADRREFVAFGPFRFFPNERLLERRGAAVPIGARALDLLVALLERPGTVVSKTELISSIWPDVTVVEGVVRVHIYAIRKALGEGVNGARYISSVAGRGYCFVAPVHRGVSAPDVGELSPGSDASLRVPVESQSGLPPALSRMVGRNEVVQSLGEWLLEHRFVTIVGAAGIGKTTVAIATAHAILESFGGAVHFVELGSLAAPAQVAATVASSVGAPLHSDDVMASLRVFLVERRVLLLLDNCEHVIEEVATLAEYLFLHAPHVHLLMTSREALRVEGERVHRLLPLDTPSEYAGMSAEQVRAYPAVQVFLDRAAASGWSGELAEDDVPLVAWMCKHLAGVALALELAASFVGECGLKGTAAILDNRVRLLWQRGRRTAPARHQTLHALIGWSYDRLSRREREILRRASIFVGAFSADGVRAVSGEASESRESLVDLLNELASKSLLSSSVEDGVVVHRMLDTTRAYALERLCESGELEDISLRHASYVTEFLERGHSRRAETTGSSCVANIRAALKWCLSTPACSVLGTRLAAAAAPLLLARGLAGECHEACRQALAALGSAAIETAVEVVLQEFFALTAMYSTRRVDGEVRAALTRAFELARTIGDTDLETRLRGTLNAFLIRIGDWREAFAVAEKSVAVAQNTAAGALRIAWMLALSHHCRGNQIEAQRHCEAGLQMAMSSRETPMPFFRRSHAALTLARTLWLRGHADRAIALARQIIAEPETLTDPVEKCVALVLCEPIFLWHGAFAEAESLLDLLAHHVEQNSLWTHRGIALAMRGQLLVKTDRPEEGTKLLKSANPFLRQTGNASHATGFAGALAEGLGAMGEIEEALGVVDEGLEISRRRGGTWDTPELLRVKGLLQMRSARTARSEAGASLTAAIELARRQGAVALELQAAITLAREHRTSGDTGAVDALADVCARFGHGMQCPHLRIAHELLEQGPRQATSLRLHHA